MDSELAGLVARLKQLEEGFERKLDARRAEFRYRLERDKVVFERSVAEHHRRIRTEILRFLRQSALMDLLTAPVVYSFVLLDFSLAVYQRLCFPIWGIGRVRRPSGHG